MSRTTITVNLSKDGFYYGQRHHHFDSIGEAHASNLVAHYRAQGITVTSLQFLGGPVEPVDTGPALN